MSSYDEARSLLDDLEKIADKACHHEWMIESKIDRMAQCILCKRSCVIADTPGMQEVVRKFIAAGYAWPAVVKEKR